MDKEMTERTPLPGPARVAFRGEVRPEDRDHVMRIVETTGFFSRAEAEVAVELVDEYLAKGERSGYHFIFADQGEKTCAYACFGSIPCTLSSFDLYWIAVSPEVQGQGLGRRLLGECEKRIKALGGTRVYIETSNRGQYASTRAFYERCGYECTAILEEFYGPGDDKVIFVRMI